MRLDPILEGSPTFRSRANECEVSLVRNSASVSEPALYIPSLCSVNTMFAARATNLAKGVAEKSKRSVSSHDFPTEG